MIESCSKKRMLTLIAVLLICSLVILLLEEYVEDNEFEASRLFKAATFPSPGQPKAANPEILLPAVPHQIKL
uniref:Uncharacterized protein n=1 Tax=Ditylenchus dipsaci TaxID=166011 RepID=A0A915D9R2_9BILA